MTVRIRSLMSGPTTIRLRSGQYVRLSPGQSSGDLHDVEVAGNAKVDKLTAQGVIEVETIGEEPETAEGAPDPDDKPAEAPAAKRRPAPRRTQGKSPDSSG
jgi:hypothetical protein